uniref:Uncharacterized protein n=1 Tax=Nothobranchius furzeri TaxID=105023 RepID=A0A1A7ZD57_NOTFU
MTSSCCHALEPNCFVSFDIFPDLGFEKRWTSVSACGSLMVLTLTVSRNHDSAAGVAGCSWWSACSPLPDPAVAYLGCWALLLSADKTFYSHLITAAWRKDSTCVASSILSKLGFTTRPGRRVDV